MPHAANAGVEAADEEASGPAFAALAADYYNNFTRQMEDDEYRYNGGRLASATPSSYPSCSALSSSTRNAGAASAVEAGWAMTGEQRGSRECSQRP